MPRPFQFVGSRFRVVVFGFSLCPIDGSLKELSIGAGGKKNRQKERRLMKGFNIAPQPSGSGSLPPVDEFTASLQQVQQENSHEIFGSTLSGIFGPGATPKKSPHHTSTNSVPGLGTSRQSRRIRGSSKKKRWENLIEAAKVRGRVSRLIGKLRDKLYIFNRKNNYNKISLGTLDCTRLNFLIKLSLYQCLYIYEKFSTSCCI